MSDAQIIMDYEFLKHDADLAGFDIKMPRIGEAYSIAIFGRKENGVDSTSPVVWFQTVKEATVWVMGYRFHQFERQDFEHGVKK